MSKAVFDRAEAVRAAIGQPLGPTPWLTVTQERIRQFADATDDHQWIHLDAERAAQGPFGAPIAHGYLTLSLLSRFMAELLEVRVRMAVNYGLEKVRFPAPVPAGARIRAQAQILSAEPQKDGSLQVGVQVTVEVEGGAKPACVAQPLFRYYF